MRKEKEEEITIVGLKTLRVGRKKISLIEDGTKRNPNSLRFVIGHIINFYHEGEREQAAEKMQAAGKIYRDVRLDRGPKVLNKDALSKIIRDRDFIAYWQLEVISKSMGLPAGALLALSRVYAMVRKEQDAAAFIAGIRAFADELEKLSNAKTISKERLDRMIDCFRSAHEFERSNQT